MLYHSRNKRPLAAPCQSASYSEKKIQAQSTFFIFWNYVPNRFPSSMIGASLRHSSFHLYGFLYENLNPRPFCDCRCTITEGKLAVRVRGCVALPWLRISKNRLISDLKMKVLLNFSTRFTRKPLFAHSMLGKATLSSLSFSKRAKIQFISPCWDPSCCIALTTIGRTICLLCFWHTTLSRCVDGVDTHFLSGFKKDKRVWIRKVLRRDSAWLSFGTSWASFTCFINPWLAS